MSEHTMLASFYADFPKLQETRAALATLLDGDFSADDYPVLTDLTDTIQGIEEPLKAWLDPMVRVPLATRFHAGQTTPFPKGYPTPFTDRWNSLHAAPTTSPAYLLNDLIEAIVPLYLITIIDQQPSFDDLVAMIQQGTVPPGFSNNNMLRNFWDGSAYALGLEGWIPTLYAPHPETNALEPAQPRPEGEFYHLPITFPTGTVYVTDSLDFDVLQQTVYKDIEGKGINVNYALHRLVRSAVLLNLGILQISVGNTDPFVYGVGDDMAIGHLDADLPALAQVDTDLWMAAMVDMQTLRDLGVAQADIDARVSSGQGTLITIPKGEWFLSWAEEMSPETFAAGCAHLYAHTQDDCIHGWLSQDTTRRPKDFL